MVKTTFKEYFKERTTHKGFVGVLLTYLLVCLFSAVYWIVDFDVRNLCMSIAFMAFAPLVLIAEHLLRIRCGELFAAAVLLLAFGAVLGTCFDFYTLIPCFDMILHAMAGVLFSAFGFTLAEVFFSKNTGARHFFGCLAFAICFSLAIAVLWEIFEYGCSFLGFDMQEDSIITRIDSYLLAGGHAETVTLDGIVKTVIYYGNGQTYTIDGYLDIGLLDTLHDMVICTIGAIVFAVVAIIGYKKCPKLNEMLIPQVVQKENDEE